MPMRPKQLLEACEEILKSFDPRVCTVDAHIEEKLGDCSSEVRRLRVAAQCLRRVRANSTPGITLLTVLHPPSLSPPYQDAHPDQIFIQQVFYGCVRYKKAVKVRTAAALPTLHAAASSSRPAIARLPLSLNHAARTSLSL